METSNSHQNINYDFLSADDIAKIEKNTDVILREIGIEIEDDIESLNALQALGGTISHNRVRLDGRKLREFISRHAPGQFTWQARNPSRSITIGNGSSIFAPVYGAAYVRNLDGARELGTIEHYQNLVALAHSSAALQTTGYLLCTVHNLPQQTCHIDMALSHLTLSDKPFMGPVASPQAIHDVAELLGIERFVPGQCHLLHLINSTPPLVYKKNPLQCLRAAAHRGQCCLITSYMMLGATGPVTVAGAIAQGYAEVLVGLALAQFYQPGLPVIMGIYGAVFSMRSMIPTYGDPASNFVQLAAMQLARKLGVPCRGEGGVTASKIDDAQAGSEGASATAIAHYGGADFVLHSAGWLESGRTVCLAKFQREIVQIPNPREKTSILPPVGNEIEIEKYNTVANSLRKKYSTETINPA